MKFRRFLLVMTSAVIVFIVQTIVAAEMRDPDVKIPGPGDEVTKDDTHGMVFDKDAELVDIKKAADDADKTMEQQTFETGLDPGYKMFNKLVTQIVMYFLESDEIVKKISTKLFKEKSTAKIERCFKRSKNQKLINQDVSKLVGMALECSETVVKDLAPIIVNLTKALKEGYDLISEAPVKIRKCTNPQKRVDGDKKEEETKKEGSRRRRGINFKYIVTRVEKAGTRAEAMIVEYGKKIGNVMYKIVNFVKKGGQMIVQLIEKGYAKIKTLRLTDYYKRFEKYGCLAKYMYAMSANASDIIQSTYKHGSNAVKTIKLARTKIRACMKKGLLQHCNVPIPRGAKDAGLNDYRLLEDDLDY